MVQIEEEHPWLDSDSYTIGGAKRYPQVGFSERHAIRRKLSIYRVSGSRIYGRLVRAAVDHEDLLLGIATEE
jgi:hypothetical protein